MSNINTKIADLRIYLGPYYKIEKINSNTVIINSPFLNSLGDNYRVFVKMDPNNQQFTIDDDGDALNEFEMMEIDDNPAKNYIKNNQLKIVDDAITEICNDENLMDAILLNLNIQMGLNALQDK